MEREEMQEILRRKTAKIAKLCEGIEPDFDAEKIHAFRTQVKKLRSLLRLINTGDGNAQIKIPKKFKRLYRIAGAIRDAQVEATRLAEWEAKLPIYSGNLINIIHRQKEEWKKHYSKDVLAQFEEKITNKYFKALSAGALEHLFQDRISGINELAAKKTPTNDQVHSMRKHVKDMMYNARFAEKKWGKAYKHIEHYPLSAIQDLSDKIGEYNDARIMLDHLQSFSSPDMPKEERDTLARLIAEKAKQQHAEKKGALDEVHKFTASVKER
jgi:CHAD domain-containing protein